MSKSLSPKLKMLVVDDQPLVCDCIQRMLAHDGHEVHVVNSGEAAVAVCRQDTFDLVFMDYFMPGMKGDESALAIKAFAPHQPILMITALASTLKDIAGVDYVIGKPFMLEELRQAISRWYNERSFAA